MIMTKTPFRMSFFGGGTDIADFYEKYGGCVISTSIDKYCYVTVRHLPRFFEHSIEVVYSRIERVNSVDEIEHPSIREAMKFLDIREIRMVYDYDLPARSGLGSSSAFAVGMLNAFHCLKGKYAEKKKLAKEAIYLERVLCQEAGGIQDQVASAFGGFNRIDFNEEGFSLRPVIMSNARKKELEENLMLFFTGIRRYSSDIQRETSKFIKDKIQVLLEMKDMVYEAEKILTDGSDLKEYGRLLDQSWRLKRGISTKISTDSIDILYNKAIEAGAVGGKLLGAGGGGYLLFYVEKEKQHIVREALENLLYVPFEFEDCGTSVIHYTAENYDMGGNE